jgi:hypothetical protein
MEDWKKNQVFDEDLNVMNVRLSGSSARVEESFALLVVLSCTTGVAV